MSLWLLSGWRRRGAWLAALVVFLLLGAVSLYLALTGQRSCGCFGRVQVNPWLTSTLDAVAVLALAFTIPPRSEDGRATGWRRGVSATVVRTVVLLALLAVSVLLMSGNPANVLARIRGDSIILEPDVSDLGDGRPGEERLFQVQLSNRTAHAIRIVGGQSSCSCTTIDNLPLTLQPGQVQGIDVRVRFRGSPGRFQHRFFVFTDDESQKVLFARFAGRVLPAPE